MRDKGLYSECTTQEILDTMRFFAEHPMARIATEDQMNTEHPDCWHRFDRFGILHIGCKTIHISSRTEPEARHGEGHQEG